MSTSSGDRMSAEEARRMALKVAIRHRSQMPENMHKYWRFRESLFSRFNEGILMDEESWYSVTPEALAYRIAVECKCKVAMDAFCGSGGNIIQFAMTCDHVIGLDIDPVKLEMAKHNAAIYGVQDRITFLCGDYQEFARDADPRARAEGHTVPDDKWEGWHKKKIDVYVSCSNHALVFSCALRPCGGFALFDISITFADMVVMFLPRNTDLDQIAQIVSRDKTKKYSAHVEEMWMGTKLKALCVYLTKEQPLAKSHGASKE